MRIYLLLMCNATYGYISNKVVKIIFKCAYKFILFFTFEYGEGHTALYLFPFCVVNVELYNSLLASTGRSGKFLSAITKDERKYQAIRQF